MHRLRPLVPLLGTVLLLAACSKSAPPPQAQATPPPKVEAAPAAEPEPVKPPIRAPDSIKFVGLAAARAENGYVAVLYENGHKGMFPTAKLAPDEIEWLTAFAAAHPLAHGKSTVVTAAVEQKKTIVKQETVNGTETVQLCAPAKLRDQIGNTCMFYGRVHYLDIAGYPVEDAEIDRTISHVPVEDPFVDFHYIVGMQLLFLHQKPSPIVHFPDPATLSPFEWARQELRKGRPILAALPEDIWLSLPADFLATHPFDGNSKIGHQVVINGFTYNPTTKKATFHVVNSWRSLAEFDVPVVARDEKNIEMEQSLSPRGEPPETAVKITAGAVTLIKAVGSQNLYSVQTNVGLQKVVALNEAAAKELVEADTSAKDADTAFGEYLTEAYDYIYSTADAKIRDAAAAQLLTEILRIPPSIPLPHVDLEVKGALYKTYFVRIAPQKVVKVYAESSADALARFQGVPKVQ